MTTPYEHLLAWLATDYECNSMEITMRAQCAQYDDDNNALPTLFDYEITVSEPTEYGDYDSMVFTNYRGMGESLNEAAERVWALLVRVPA